MWLSHIPLSVRIIGVSQHLLVCMCLSRANPFCIEGINLAEISYKRCVQGVFAASGVALEKLVVVPEPVDSVFFDPSKASPLPLPQGQLVFGTEQAVDTKADHAFISVIPAS